MVEGVRVIWDPAMETLPRADLARLQLERLQQVAARVYERVPLFRRRFDQAGIPPGAIRSLDDIARLPFTNKRDFRDDGGKLRRIRDERHRS